MLKWIALIALILNATPAQAHKVITSAWLDDKDIEGEVGLSNGDVALPGTDVIVLDENGNEIGKTTIIEDGLFRFTPTQPIAHRFTANLGAGHVADVLVSVAELPEHLRTGSSTAASVQDQETTKDTDMVINGDIAKIVAKAVRAEVQPLRKEIAAYKEKNDLQTILGGIGYILGITGIAFYIAARKKGKTDA